MLATPRQLGDSPVRPQGAPPPRIPQGCRRAAVRGTAPRAPRWAEGPGPPAPAPPPAEAASPSASSGPVSPAASRRVRRAAPSSARPPVRPAAAAAPRREAAAVPAPLQLRGTSAARQPGSRARPQHCRHRGYRCRPHCPWAAPSRAPRAALLRIRCRALCSASRSLLAALPGTLGAAAAGCGPLPPLGPRWCGPLLRGCPARGSFAKSGSWRVGC